MKQTMSFADLERKIGFVVNNEMVRIQPLVDDAFRTLSDLQPQVLPDLVRSIT